MHSGKKLIDGRFHSDCVMQGGTGGDLVSSVAMIMFISTVLFFFCCEGAVVHLQFGKKPIDLTCTV